MNEQLSYALQKYIYLLRVDSPQGHYTRNCMVPRLPKHNTSLARMSNFRKIIKRYNFYYSNICLQQTLNINKGIIKRKIISDRNFKLYGFVSFVPFEFNCLNCLSHFFCFTLKICNFS